jgi:hypothetical protein
MDSKRLFQGLLSIVSIMPLFLLIPQKSFSDNQIQPECCLENAVERIEAIRELPGQKYLHTLDGQNVLLEGFHAMCFDLFPSCYLFAKFYYWAHETKEIVSLTKKGPLRHKVRCYYNCLTEFCPGTRRPEKTHGDVAEFYDDKGRFMGLAVYMGDGKYCTLPYWGYGQ